MKKRIFAFSILALVTLAGLYACHREDNPFDNGNGQQQFQEVKAQFVFSVATGSPATKQTADAAQADGRNGAFRGIGKAKLMAYALTKEENSETVPDDGKILITDTDAPKIYNLSSVMGSASGSATSELSSRRVLEMSFPLQTNTLLFYGKSPDINVSKTVQLNGNGDEVTFGAKDYYRFLDSYEITDKVGSANFQLGKRLENKAGFEAMKKLLAGILTVIMNTSLDGTEEIDATDTPDGNEYPYGFSFGTEGNPPCPQISWADYAGTKSPVTPTDNLYPLEQKLSYLYEEMTSIWQSTEEVTDPVTSEVTEKVTGVELRAGSGEAVLRVLKDLWTVVNEVRCAEPISKEEAVAKYLAEQINLHLQDYVTSWMQIGEQKQKVAAVPGDGSPITEITFNNLKGSADSGDDPSKWGIIKRFSEDPYWVPSTDYEPSSTALASFDNKTSLVDFPLNFNILRGAAYLAFKDGYFYYPDHFDTSAMGDGKPKGDSEDGFSAEDYFYPAELLYFGNSPVRTSDVEFKKSAYPEYASNWEDDASWYKYEGNEVVTDSQSNPVTDWTGTHVVSTTRSVAMKYNIRYGVAMLETKVGYTTEVCGTGGSGGTHYLLDNNSAIQGRYGGNEDDKRITVTDNSFKLTGIVIGGQPKNVGWDFLPICDPQYATGTPGEEGYTASTVYSTGFIYDKAVVNTNIPLNNGSTFTPNYTVVFDNYNDVSKKAGKAQDKVYVALEFQNNTGEDFYGNFNLIPDGGYFYLIGELDPQNKLWPDGSGGHVIPPYTYENNELVKTPRVFIQDYKTSVTFKFGTNSLKYAYLSVPDLRASSLTLGLSVDIEWQEGITYDEVVIGGN